MTSPKWALLLLVVSSTAVANLLDSIITPPPLLSIDNAEKVRTYFYDSNGNACRLPGSVLHFGDDTTCFSPTLNYINSYSSHLTGTNDSLFLLGTTDTLPVYHFRMAASTFRRLGIPRRKNRRLYRFEHATYLSYLEEEEPVKELPFVYRALIRFSGVINRSFLQPFLKLFLAPALQLSLFWKVTVFTLGIAIFVVVVVVLGKFMARVIPVMERNENKIKSKYAGAAKEPLWLQKSRQHFENSLYPEALECLYRYLVSWFLDRKLLQRHEWWTNRQFLSIIENRFRGDLPVAGNIIAAYEEVIFGHYPADQKRLEELIAKAGTLTGRNT